MNHQQILTAKQPDSYINYGQIDVLNDIFEGKHPDRVLQWSFDTYGSEVALGTGFGPSGVFLMHRIYKLGLGIPVFYLDTNLLFDQTYKLRDRLQEKLGIKITQVTPSLTLDEQKEKFGDELWNRNPDQCCYIRKVEPLKRYLSDKKGWITGIRRNQSDTRKNTRILEYDDINQVLKLNPLAELTSDEIWDYINDHELPYNPLHDDGYPSIGCIPCTSPVKDGEDERNGRWRGVDKTECGIHFSKTNGKVVRGPLPTNGH